MGTSLSTKIDNRIEVIQKQPIASSQLLPANCFQTQCLQFFVSVEEVLHRL